MVQVEACGVLVRLSIVHTLARSDRCTDRTDRCFSQLGQIMIHQVDRLDCSGQRRVLR